MDGFQVSKRANFERGRNNLPEILFDCAPFVRRIRNDEGAAPPRSSRTSIES
jgi:hypothetical protein